mmetsp:Transcript_113847/g.327146  ORF Transcript_113847/g.327146 Transcript_113847/m.327146 type:complete len:684 (+) Transcript_113847:122-2173(+)
MEDHGYTVIRVLGQGGSCQSRVYEVRNKEGKLRVLKQLPWVSEDNRESAMREVKLLASLRHPCIVAYLESFLVRSTPSLPSEDVLCLVMARCERDLRQECLRLRLDWELAREGGSQPPGTFGVPRFDEEQVLSWLSQLCWGLLHLHSRKLLHRDLKPQNVLLTHSGRRALLADFGVCGQVDHTEDMRHSIVGTPAFMSPEMLQGRPYGLKTDQWALGCVLFETMALEPPFAGRIESYAAVVNAVLHAPPVQAPPGYSLELSGTVEALLARKPHERPSNRDLLRSPLLRDPFQAFLSSLEGAAAAAPVDGTAMAARAEVSSLAAAKTAATACRSSSTGGGSQPGSQSCSGNAAAMAAMLEGALHEGGGDGGDALGITSMLSTALDRPPAQAAGEGLCWATAPPRMAHGEYGLPKGSVGISGGRGDAWNVGAGMDNVIDSSPDAMRPRRGIGVEVGGIATSWEPDGATASSSSTVSPGAHGSIAASLGQRANAGGVQPPPTPEQDDGAYSSDFDSVTGDGEDKSSEARAAEDDVDIDGVPLSKAEPTCSELIDFDSTPGDDDDGCAEETLEDVHMLSVDDPGLGQVEWRHLLDEAEALLRFESEDEPAEASKRLREAVIATLGEPARVDQALNFLRNRRPLGETLEADELMLQVELGDLLGDDGLSALPLLERLVELEGDRIPES